MAKSGESVKKRKKELAKKEKKDQKRQRKLDKKTIKAEENPNQFQNEGSRLDDLFLSFQTKGFMPIEIPGLIQDVFNMLGKGRYCTISNVNKELEGLGWGIEIMDNITYDLINSLFNKKWQTSLS